MNVDSQRRILKTAIVVIAIAFLVLAALGCATAPPRPRGLTCVRTISGDIIRLVCQ